MHVILQVFVGVIIGIVVLALVACASAFEWFLRVSIETLNKSKDVALVGVFIFSGIMSLMTSLVAGFCFLATVQILIDCRLWAIPKSAPWMVGVAVSALTIGYSLVLFFGQTWLDRAEERIHQRIALALTRLRDHRTVNAA